MCLSVSVQVESPRTRQLRPAVRRRSADLHHRIGESHLRLERCEGLEGRLNDGVQMSSEGEQVRGGFGGGQLVVNSAGVR